MNYPEAVREHYQRPRNVGALDKNDSNVGTGQVGAVERGVLIRLQVRLNPESDVIEDTRFRTFGCGWAIASCSRATEWMKGKTAEAALANTVKIVIQEMSLPPEKEYCAALVAEALAEAITDARTRRA
jgi:nitrogen fixation NifU-like protein